MKDIQDIVHSDPASLHQDNSLAGTLLHSDAKSIAVCLTLYNEDISLFRPSLDSILTSIGALGAHNPEYQHAVIAVIIDGKNHLSQSVRAYLADLHLADIPRAEHMPAASITQTRICCPTDIHTDAPCNPLAMPVTLRVITKDENAGKLDSHWWFYETVCVEMNPNYCFQIDSGSLLSPEALLEICETFDANSDTAAVAGNILIEPAQETDLLHRFQCGDFAVQKTIRWPSEVFSGYLSVIPGQFSGMRWRALSHRTNDGGSSAKDRYLRGRNSTNAVEKIMFLAEDRVLGFELLTDQEAHNTLQFAPRATSYTDACDTVGELLQQRRRWINGSLFCLVMMFATVLRSILKPRQTRPIKISTILPLLNLGLQHLLQWFLPLINILILAVTSNSLFSLIPQYETYKALAAGTLIIMTLIWILPAFLAVSGMLQKWSNRQVQLLMGFIIADFLMVVVINATGIVQQPQLTAHAYFLFMPLILSLAAFFGAAVLNPEAIRHLRTSILTFIALAPSLWLMMSSYAFFNLDDGSWGTKGLLRTEHNRATTSPITVSPLRRLRLRVMSAWLASNLILATMIIQNDYLLIILGTVGVLQVLLILSGVMGAVSINLRQRVNTP